MPVYTIEALVKNLEEEIKNLEEERKTAQRVDKENFALLEASKGKTFPCNKFQYSEEYPEPTDDEAKRKEPLAAKCPNCNNVDMRHMLHDDDKERSSFVIVETYSGSGVDLKCLCCQKKFKFCTGRSLWKQQNCIPVPLGFVRKVLGVDINQYM